MAQYVRRNAFRNGGDFTNEDLRWYAKGVGRMMGRALDDPASWWFFAAMHGEYVDPETPWYQAIDPPAFPDWQFITAAPAVPTSPLPAQGVRDLFWNQCQHASWYFLPWHRGYLMALEAQLRADIVALGGPADWSLPYWDYFGGPGGSEYAIPPAFLEQQLDGQSNPLYVAKRYGPDGDGTIYIPTAAWEAANPAAPPPQYGSVTSACLQNDLFTGSDARTRPPGFGGPQTGFEHGRGAHGNMESNPHDLVHVYVGGEVSATDYGLMADPGIAALDPIFYLHHCCIDRLWGRWNAAGNSNPTTADWLDGPAPRHFVMPWPGTDPWYYSPKQVAKLSDLDYAYDELGTIPAAPHPLAARLELLGAPAAAERFRSGRAMLRLPRPPELLGASATGIALARTGTRSVNVRLDSGVRRQLAQSLIAPTETSLPDRTYLQLESVTGTTDATVLGVYLNLAADASPAAQRNALAGEAALFGLRRASVPDGDHGGGGLTFIFDITPFADALALNKQLDVGSVQVSIVPRRTLPEGAKVTVGRISIYREAL
jgi:tyrosinase